MATSKISLPIPSAWHDTSLLAEQPFLDEFACRSAEGDGRRRTNWTKQLAQRIFATVDVRSRVFSCAIPGPQSFANQGRAAATQWAKYAFAPEGEVRRPPKVDYASLGCVEFFVAFYWALYNAEGRVTHAVLKVLNVERKRRGFGYRLEYEKTPQASLPRNVTTRAQQVSVGSRSAGPTAVDISVASAPSASFENSHECVQAVQGGEVSSIKGLYSRCV